MSPPFDERRAVKEIVERAGVARHEGREPSDPPGWPPDVHEPTRPGLGGPLPPHRATMPSLEQIGNAAASLHKIYLLLAAIAAAFAALVIWINSRASRAELDEKVTTVAATQKATDDDRDKMITKLSERVVVLETKLDEMSKAADTRWNGLDRILQQQFGQTTLQPSPPAFGPAARGKGRAGP